MSWMATTISTGFGPMRGAQAPGSYIRAQRDDRMVTVFSQRAPSPRSCILQVEVDRVLAPVGRRLVRVGADDRLHAGRLAFRPGALVVAERFLQGDHAFRGDAAQALLVTADGGHLGDHAGGPVVGGAQHQHVAARVTAAPDADPASIDLRQGLEIGEGTAPVLDLAPRVDIVARLPAAQPETAVIVQEHDESGGGEFLGIPGQAVPPRPRKAVRHGDRRARSRASLGPIEPGAQFHTVVELESDVFALRHVPSRFVGSSVEASTIMNDNS